MNRFKFFVLLFFLLGCSSLKTQDASQNGMPLNGNWKLASKECSGGELNERGLKFNKGLKTGQLKINLYVNSDNATAEIRSVYSPEQPSSICLILATENWQYDKDQLTVSNTVIDRVGTGKYHCTGHAAEFSSRSHKYTFENNVLKIFVLPRSGPTLDGRRNRGSICTNGAEVFVYQKIQN